jgi:hypothetical protein
MKGFIEIPDFDRKDLKALININTIVKVEEHDKGCMLMLTPRNAVGMPYMVSTTFSYEEIKALIIAAQ